MPLPDRAKVPATYASGLILGGLTTLTIHLLVRKGTNLGIAGIEGPAYPIDADTLIWTTILGALFGCYYASVLLRRPERWWVPLVLTMIPCACCGTCLVPQDTQAASTGIGIVIYASIPFMIMAYTALAKWLIWQENKE